jgi:hypothetical protein
VRADDPANDLFDPAVSPDGSTLAVTVASGIGGPVTGHIALYNYATSQFERNLTSGTNRHRTPDHPAHAQAPRRLEPPFRVWAKSGSRSPLGRR